MPRPDDQQILATIDAAFASIERPEHFTDWQHCCECAEHDALLCSRDRQSLQLEDVNNPGWDPLCFCSAQGLAWYFPALARLVLLGPQDLDWYGGQLLFHLGYGGEDNRLLRFCNAGQRAAVLGLLEHLINSRIELLEPWVDEQLFAQQLWEQAAS